MESFKNIGIKDYFKRYGYWYGLLRAIFTKCPVHIVNDYENKKILYYLKTEKKLAKKYLKYANKDPEGIIFKECNADNTVWVYWKQGIENAPRLIQECITSIVQHTENNVVILDEENVSNYIIFPDYILNKVKNGNMSAAAFSDLLRFTLLEHFGGTWIDATVFLTDKIPDYILSSDLFSFQDAFGLIRNPALMSVWFLHSRKENVVIKETRNMIYEYWKHEDYVIEYLLPYILLMIAVNNNVGTYENMPYANSDYCHLLLNELGNKFDESKYKHINTLSNVHKLSYKLADYVYEDESNFYNKIINLSKESE